MPDAIPLLARYELWQQQRNLSPVYISDSRWTLLRVASVIPVMLEHATEQDLAGWYGPLVHTNSPESRGCYLSHVSAFYAWLVRERIRDDNPADRLPRPKHKRALPRPMRTESLDRALAAARAPVREMLLLAAYAGLRAAEIAGLRREDLLFDADPPVILVRAAKGGRQRIIPAHPLIVEALAHDTRVSCADKSVRATGPVLQTRFGRPFTSQAVSQRASRFLRELGIDQTLHTARHWFATNVYRQSCDIRLTQELLGHASPTTTARYAAWAPERAAVVVNAL